MVELNIQKQRQSFSQSPILPCMPFPKRAGPLVPVCR